MKSIFIGFDFSMNKPAATLLYDQQFYHLIWPSDLSEKHQNIYKEHDVYCYSRGLSAVSTKDKNSQIVLEHTIRSTELANLIIDTLDYIIDDVLKISSNTPIYISSEGLSYGSKGDAALNLATYKGVLLSKLYEKYKDRLYGLYTYSPITLKATAGCAAKSKQTSKTPMIDAFMREPVNNKFHNGLIAGDFINKTTYIHCVDDIVDSYWALITMIKKEGFIK